MFKMVPRDNQFFAQFEKAADTLCAAAETYRDVLTIGPQLAAEVHRIRDHEHECDKIVHETLNRLDSTFLTPFDREDIQALMKRLDNVVDAIDAAAKRVELYKIERPPQGLIELAEVLIAATATIKKAMPELRTLRRPDELRGYIREVDKFEKEGDNVHHGAIADLYNNEASNPVLIMKLKEIYDLTERAVDRCEDVANVMETILFKSA